MTIYEIKELTKVNQPYFFSRKTMKFFNQTLKDFNVKKQSDGKYLITAPSYWIVDGKKKLMGHTQRLFNPITNDLEYIKKEEIKENENHNKNI